MKIRNFFPFVVCIFLVSFTQSAASNGAKIEKSADLSAPAERKKETSPVRQITQKSGRDTQASERNRGGDESSDDTYRTITGHDNNQRNEDMGAIYTQLQRLLPADYADDVSDMPGSDRKSAREVSNIMSAQTGNLENNLGASDYLWQWGQFLDHDIDLTEGTDPAENEYIEVPENDPYFIPGETMAFNRSLYDKATGEKKSRQQLNEITAWIDASNVYGSEEERALALRMLDGTGRLKISAGNLLPFNTEGFPNAGGENAELFLAGDVRANEQVGLTAMHTLFVREHNRLATELASQNTNWSGEQIYQKARQLVGAQMQAITYNEYLPELLGDSALQSYRGYSSRIDARIMNCFSTAAYRYGHSALSPQLLRLNNDGSVSDVGHLPLRSAFFSPDRIRFEGGIEPILLGLAHQKAQKIDILIIDDVRNFLFGTPPANGFDLAALNIQRGRDHGLPTYNEFRRAMGMRTARRFSDISRDSEVQFRLAQAYESVDDIDLWVGGLSEDNVRGSHVGELFHRIITKQFEYLRDGDRYWYQRTLSRREIRDIESTRLADIIRRNTDIGEVLQDNVFVARELPNQ